MIITAALPADLREIHDEAMLLKQEIRERQERLDALADSVRSLDPGEYGQPDTGQIVVSQQPRRFSDDRALTVIPPEDLPRVRVTVIDKQAVKNLDPTGDLYEACMAPNPTAKRRVTFQ